LSHLVLICDKTLGVRGAETSANGLIDKEDIRKLMPAPWIFRRLVIEANSNWADLVTAYSLRPVLREEQCNTYLLKGPVHAR
jgi:hypothetical protein